MDLAVTLFVFLLFSSGVYLMQKRHIFEVLLGTLLLSQGTNLILISMGGWKSKDHPPILIDEAVGYTDPLPQALILTAIVIGFGVTAFLLVLIFRGYEESNNMEIGEEEKEPGEA